MAFYWMLVKVPMAMRLNKPDSNRTPATVSDGSYNSMDFLRCFSNIATQVFNSHQIRFTPRLWEKMLQCQAHPASTREDSLCVRKVKILSIASMSKSSSFSFCACAQSYSQHHQLSIASSTMCSMSSVLRMASDQITSGRNAFFPIRWGGSDFSCGYTVHGTCLFLVEREREREREHHVNYCNSTTCSCCTMFDAQ